MKKGIASKAPALSHNFFALLSCGAAIVLLGLPGAVSASPEQPAPAGTCFTLFAENFDGVPAPALPPGWQTGFTAGSPNCTPTGACAQGSNWTTAAGTPDSPPNAAFHDDPSCVINSTLDTPAFSVTAATSGQVSFRNNFNLENTFDGGVLEIALVGQAFTDILQAGGTFVTGGYNGTISTAFLSPIAGRPAWTGNSGGYITTTVNLPTVAAGQIIQLRFRMASDCSVSGAGWHVDTILVTTGPCPLPTPTPTCAPPAEGFDDITTLASAGWFIQNNSQPGPGTISWFQGNSAVFPAHSGAAASSYIGVNFNSGTGTSTLSNWLLTPPLQLQTGQLAFFTRTVDVPQFADRLQVRMSTNGASTDVGTTATSVGDFTTLLLDLNPNYAVDGYPTTWTLFKVQLNVPGPAPVTGRIAFRYFVENGGPTGANSDYIGIDTLRISGGTCGGVATPTPTPPASPVILSPLVATGLLGKQCIYQFEAFGANFLDVTNLPPGLNFDKFLSAIVGVPTQAGNFSVGLSASNAAGGTTNAILALSVQPVPPAGPVIASSTAATGRVGQPFTFHVLTIGGSPAARLITDNLPAGLSADAVTGVISGTPTEAGSSAVALTVNDGNFTANALLQLTFVSDSPRPVIVSSDIASLTVGQPFSYTIRAPSGSTEKTVYSLIGGLPGGLGFDPATGTIAGIYSPRPGTGGGGPDVVDLTGGALVGSVQLFGTNSNGSGTIQLLFLTAPSGLVNISTRMLVGTDDNVLIGGFIVTGNAPKVVITRALGPSLTASGISGALSDPTLELHDGAHPEIVVSNNNWRDTQQQIIQDTGIPPTDDRESAIVVALDPGNYTAIVRGTDNMTGVAVVEVYDLGTASINASSNSKLAQISTRGTVLTNDNVMIGGFIIAGATTNVLLRAIGPELNGIVPGALQDTVLELRDGSGSLIASNDDWRSTQEQEIINTGVPPTDNRESAIFATLSPGAYTAIVSGKNGTTGVALVEVYGLQ